MNTDKIMREETARYNKIKQLTALLCAENADSLADMAADCLDKPFKVGKRITVDGQNMIINKKKYCAYDIKEVTISTEGSMSVYDRGGKKLCGWAALNLSLKNIELFCLWVRKNNIPARAVSGKLERNLQLAFLTAAAIAVFLIKLLHTFLRS